MALHAKVTSIMICTTIRNSKELNLLYKNGHSTYTMSQWNSMIYSVQKASCSNAFTFSQVRGWKLCLFLAVILLPKRSNWSIISSRGHNFLPIITMSTEGSLFTPSFFWSKQLLMFADAHYHTGFILFLKNLRHSTPLCTLLLCFSTERPFPELRNALQWKEQLPANHRVINLMDELRLAM